MMEKKTFEWHGKKYYLLGTSDGEYYYLQKESWDCEWYWGIGYIETFTNKSNPHMSKDINSHSHFDYMFMKDTRKNCKDKMEEFFDDMVLNDKERYVLWELMSSLYTLRKTADMFSTAGSHITTNPCRDLLDDKEMADKLNHDIMPKLFAEVDKLFS